MRCTPPGIIYIAPFIVKNRILRSGRQVLQGALQQADLYISFRLQKMPEAMGNDQRPDGADRVYKQRMRPVEGVNKAAIFNSGPAACLHGACDL